jgi:surface carbohydrate biosynthesis protein
MKKIDILWLLEHKVREMDIACAVKAHVQTRHELGITIQNIYLHANEVMREYIPRLVVFPFLYRTSDLAIEDYIQVWPRATYFNLAWEQVHYKAHLKMKAPGDDFSRRKVIHHAWGAFYKNYLVEGGVPQDHIFVNGNPVYQLYKKPYNRFFKQREWLARQYNLDASKKWVFIPENYKWAFFSDEKLKSSAERGGNYEEHLGMRAFCRESLKQLLCWCNEIGGKDGVEIIFRPRPATNSKQMDLYFREHVGDASAHLHFTKAETVREWVLASDVVISSYSTSLIEAAVAGKTIYMVEPIPIPDSLYCDWYGYVPRIHTSADFEQACLAPIEHDNRALQTWAESAMLANGDPIKGLADFIASLAEGAESRFQNRASADDAVLVSRFIRVKWRSKRLISYTWKAIHSLLSAVKVVVLHLAVGLIHLRSRSERQGEDTLTANLSDRMRQVLLLLSQGFADSNYFNPVTHEGDVFTEADVDKQVGLWQTILEKHQPRGTTE